uniref:hypothetical protein n=1 Tax=Pelomonas sp. KK5 TaxID=1855730 RepID=UPI001E2BB78C
MQRLISLASLVVLSYAGASFAAGSAGLINANGLGPVRFGMTVAQYGNALHESVSEPSDPEDRGCFFLRSKRFPDTYFMFEDGLLRRIDVHSRKIVTQDGVRVGTPVIQVKRRYGSKLADEPHHYSGPDDRYLTLSIT